MKGFLVAHEGREAGRRPSFGTCSRPLKVKMISFWRGNHENPLRTMDFPWVSSVSGL